MPKGAYPRNENQRRASSERMKRLWRDPETRARWSKAAHDRMVARNADPVFQKSVKPKIIASNRTAAKRAKISAASKKAWADPARRARHSEEMRRRMADPVKRAAAIVAGRRGSAKQYGNFRCPPHLKKLYQKLRRELGVDAARREIRRMEAHRHLGTAA